MELKYFINPKYLDKHSIISILKQKEKMSPIEYMCLDDFINQDFFEKIINEMRGIEESKLDMHIYNERKNYSVWLEGEYLAKLHDFFESQEFSKYLSIFFGQSLIREIYFPRTDIKKINPNLNENGLLGQFYEKGDKFGWHIDGPIDGGALGTFTYYIYNTLEKEYNYADGGYLELGKKKGREIVGYKKIAPVSNRIILLPVSNIAWHQVTEIYNKKLKRYSIQSTLFKN